MKKKTLGLLVVVLLLGVATSTTIFSDDEKKKEIAKEPLLAEHFIQNYLLREDGRMQTDLLDQQDVYLSETVGLWMDYLVAKNDVALFDQQVEALETYFLTKDHLVTWELQGTSKAPANAFIDDLRIINALYEAGEKWHQGAYLKLAAKMGKSLIRYQMNDDLLVDHVDLESKYKGENITLSYIIPAGFDRLQQLSLPDQTYDMTKQVLLEAPVSPLGFFPKTYHVKTQSYSYDTEINLIDQFYVGYHRAQWQGDVTPLLDFTKTAFAKGDGKLYGRYNRDTGEATVPYEAAAVYALAILMCLEIEEQDFAKQLFNQMKTLQQANEKLPYYGGYTDIYSKDTHTFDNLLALLAERKGIDEEAF
ncbi:putative lipoprotein ydaj [Bacillus sp. OxB-1]|uniref:glycosyl hydrolase family 8 n=1 Tax=Bacillus sp. (strain OxB-1) TaxID=98228 RepID=UPI000581E689|nr:glycosyl hydrolase family 8 [Bacillus sp. OxB-1]BAQ09587.1 putative lipoprotein ydaj [Bacillus sp. OxB-1]